MKKGLTDVRDCCKHMQRAIENLDVWERIWVPGRSEKGINGLFLSVNAASGAKLDIHLTVEEVTEMAVVLTKILEARVEEAECKMADATFAVSFPETQDEK